VSRYADARDDYDVFRGLAERLGFGESFSEGRDEQAWVRHIFDQSRELAAGHGIDIPAFEEFWQGGHFSLAPQLPDAEFILEAFHRDPDAHPLGTPSGKIEIYSDTIAGFGYDDCPGHPAWLDKVEWLGAPLSARFPLHLISGQPTPRLHSQLDHSRVSRATKISGREPLTMHPEAAAARGIEAGAVVRVFNERGACLAGVLLSPDMRADVVQLATGAWYDPIDTADGLGLCVHGNPNVLTRDVGTSKLGQGPIAHSCLVEVELYTDPLPDISVFSPPDIIRT
jgi:biotin/methionine sulfoxide reductase